MRDKESTENMSPWVDFPGSRRLHVVEPERGPKSTVMESLMLRGGELNGMTFDAWHRERDLCLWPLGLVMEQAAGRRV